MQLFYIGWKDLRQALRNCSDKTAKEWVKKYDIPVRYLGRHPIITVAAFAEWWKTLPDSIREEITSNLPTNNP